MGKGEGIWQPTRAGSCGYHKPSLCYPHLSVANDATRRPSHPLINGASGSKRRPSHPSFSFRGGAAQNLGAMDGKRPKANRKSNWEYSTTGAEKVSGARFHAEDDEQYQSDVLIT